MSITGLPGQGPGARGRHSDRGTSAPGCSVRSASWLALLEREKSKKGQHITTSLLQQARISCFIALIFFQVPAIRWLGEGGAAAGPATIIPTSIPYRRCFKTSDGHINIAIDRPERSGSASDHALGDPDLITRPEYATAAARSKNRERAQCQNRRAHGF